MKPRLVAISGPAAGQTFPLLTKPFTIGRSADCDLRLESLEISRRHCELLPGSDGGYTLQDLGSRHGVFVNGRPVRQHQLVHSDLLTLGGSVLLFLLNDTDTRGIEPRESARLAGSRRTTGRSTFARRATEILLLDPAHLDAELPVQARIARDLQTLLRWSTELQGPLLPEQCGERVVAALLEALPAQRTQVLWWQPGDEQPQVLAQRSRQVEPGPASRDGIAADGIAANRTLVETIVEKAVHERCTQLTDSTLGTRVAAPLLDPAGESVLAVLTGETHVAGAFDAHHLDLLEGLSAVASLALANSLQLQRLEAENRRLQAQQLQHDLIGASAAMRRLLDLIGKVARSDTTVLLRGESGTGKELTAQAIHRSSARSAGPFVAVNCATLSETLLESELFGHEKGAFTGAVARKPGKFETAGGGTLFLDEVGEIPPPIQAKLLRVVQERQFERVGGTRPIDVDVRIVAATNRDLEAAIRAGEFREDLYYRLKVITLEPPPLRQRRDDIPLLCSHFLAVQGRRLGRLGVTVSQAAERCLQAYDWPGNVRELGNVIERALVLGETDVVEPEDLPEEVRESTAEVPSEFQAALVEFKRKLILDAYRAAGGDYGVTADRLGIHVNSLHRMIRRLGIKDQLDE